MDFSTLVDLDDYFEDGADAIADAFPDEAGDILGMVGEDLPLPEMPEMEPLKEPEYAEIPEPERYEEPALELLPAPRIEQLKEEASKTDNFGEFWKKLSDKERESLFRTVVGAVGGGAKEALRSVQQRREQEFQRETMDINYQRRREEEDRAREERRIQGTPQAVQFNVAPRGIIGGGMGG